LGTHSTPEPCSFPLYLRSSLLRPSSLHHALNPNTRNPRPGERASKPEARATATVSLAAVAAAFGGGWNQFGLLCFELREEEREWRHVGSGSSLRWTPEFSSLRPSSSSSGHDREEGPNQWQSNRNPS